jgi:hypothetical protein
VQPVATIAGSSTSSTIGTLAKELLRIVTLIFDVSVCVGYMWVPTGRGEGLAAAHTVGAAEALL